MTICVTGHRTGPKLGGYENPTVHNAIRLNLSKWINKFYQEGHRTFISGGATGVDQFFAAEVLELKKLNPLVQLVIAAPFPSQPSKWPAHVRAAYFELCKAADRYYYVSPDPYAAWKMQTRNIWMVDSSDEVLAMWDGTSGGTRNCVDYASSKNKRVWHLSPFSEEHQILGG